MPHSKLDDLHNGKARWPMINCEGFKSLQGGDMEVGLTPGHEYLDCTYKVALVKRHADAAAAS